MQNICLQTVVLDHSIRVTALPAGGDWVIRIEGGCAPHVGSVSVAAPGMEQPRHWVGPHHRDDVVGDRFAWAVHQKTGGTVSVSCGIHYDAPGKAGLAQIVAACDGLLEELLDKMN